jgi:hypothetical protein
MTSIFVTIFTVLHVSSYFFVVVVVLTSIRDEIFVAESYIVKNSSGMATRHRFKKKN